MMMMMMMIREYASRTRMRLPSSRNFSMKSMRGAHHLGTRTRVTTTTRSSPCSLFPSSWSKSSFTSNSSSSLSSLAVEETSADKTTKSPTAGVMNMYNSLTQQIQSLPTGVVDDDNQEEGHNNNNRKRRKGIACYTCGPTTYAPAHLGHARTYVQLDIFRRVLEYASRIQQIQIQQHHDPKKDSRPSSPPIPLPLFVMNITDVDDKILAAAAEHETNHQQTPSPLQLARRYEAAFWNDLDALNCLRPHVVTRVTEHVESDIIPYIQQLVDLEMAYVIQEEEEEEDDDGVEVDASSSTCRAVYFDVRAFEDKMQHRTRYGKLAPPSASTNFFSRTESSTSSSSESELPLPIELNEQKQKKRDDRDFALWKPRKRGESMYWTSPSWGEGRPGWHIECSAMILAVQQKFCDSHVFAIHAGGVDLKFPHHTNEIAQAEAYHSSLRRTRSSSSSSGSTCCEWIPHWIHTGHLYIGGQKMSKSLKNFVTIEELLTDPAYTDGIDSPAMTSSSSPLSSPADDFRLWCLGLSGSYRGPATFSRERILEARSVRQKLVRFLLQGYEWLVKHHQKKDNDIMDSPKKWQESDYHLFQTTSTVSANAMHALLYSDLDGSAFVKQVVQLAEAGTAHMHSIPPGQGPVEAVFAAMETLQTLLALVGFTDATTCRSRAANVSVYSNNNNTNLGSVVVGGERALLDEFVEFRKAVRQFALRQETGKNAADDSYEAEMKLKKIMQLCDEARDCTFPALGVELMDASVVDEGYFDQSNVSPLSTSSSSSWRYCLPRTKLKQLQETPDVIGNSAKAKGNTLKKKKQQQHNGPLPIEDLFRLGVQYAGQFSSFDPNTGFPTLLADGTELSNNLRKKLEKKRIAYAKELKRREQQ